jgi:regulator of sigma E protease
VNAPAPPDPTGTAIPAAPEDAPLTARGWLAQNGILMLVMVAFAGFLFSQVGVEGLVPMGLAALGLGFLIFIHELGHFLAAKWCDVHVKTFSIGFGPAVPGCQFTLGETTYMIGILPLGGYVNMVGEGTEGDEDEQNPRSFKSKSVLQRMFIISAGVLMNVLFALVCFVAIFRINGVERYPAVVWEVDAGSPAWEQGVRVNWKVNKIDHRSNPFFDDLKYAVANSSHGAILDFEFEDRDGNTVNKPLIPIRDANSPMPTIGVRFPMRLKLLPPEAKRLRSSPVRYNSAAAHARALPLERGDVLVAINDESAGEKPFETLGKRLLEAAPGAAMNLRIKRASGKEETLTLPAASWEFGDEIVACTDPSTPDEPFHITPLPLDPTHETKRQMPDPFAYRQRVLALLGKPMVVEVQRNSGKEATRVKLFIPPSFTRDLGVRMKMGQLAAVRVGSPAEKAGLARGVVISQVGVKYGDEAIDWTTFKDFNPVRLPEALYQHVHSQPQRKPSDYSVVFKVWATIKHHAAEEKQLEPIAWDDSWALGDESPLSPASPMSIPQLGIAYQVESTVVAVKPGSVAEKAGLKPGDEVVQLRSRSTGKTPDVVQWSSWQKLASDRGKDGKIHDQWAYYHWTLHRLDSTNIELQVKRDGQLLPDVLTLEEAPFDPTWPTTEQGFIFLPDTHRQKADSLMQAMGFGLVRSVEFIKNILLNLKNILTGRISYESIGGPKMIAEQAYSFASEDWFVFLQFLAIISINLAVVNFLPIPVLDGGHMVFLIYEWVRGKPPSDAVKNTATYIGVAFLLGLMVFVFYLDFTRTR